MVKFTRAPLVRIVLVYTSTEPKGWERAEQKGVARLAKVAKVAKWYISPEPPLVRIVLIYTSTEPKG